MQVGYSAILFYGYVGIIGFLLFAVLRWGFKGETTLVQTWCTYGQPLLSRFNQQAVSPCFPASISRQTQSHITRPLPARVEWC